MFDKACNFLGSVSFKMWVLDIKAGQKKGGKWIW